MLRLGLMVVCCASAVGCGLSTHVRPTAKGVLSAEASVGGPAAKLSGAPVPLPLSAVGASYGVHERFDVSAHVQLTTLLAFKLAGFDLGGSALVVTPSGWRPALSLGLRGSLFTDFSSGTLGYVDVFSSASWDTGTRARPFVQLTAQWDSLGHVVTPALGLGAEVRLGHGWFQAELTWFAPDRDTQFSSIDWLSIAHRGAVGLVLGGRYDWALLTSPPE